jgi:uncharacterized glyoxalase superfamily protein PhnB
MITPRNSFPVFIVKSLEAAKSFYLEHLGFSVVYENEWYLHMVTESGVQVGFLLPDQPTQPDFFHPAFQGSGVILSLEVTDADRAFKEAQDKNIDVVLSLRSEEWGQRHFILKDPNGIYVDIVQEIQPTQEYQEGYKTD